MPFCQVICIIWCLLLQSKDLPTYKDNDFIRDEAVLFLGKDTKDKLMTTITKDAEVNYSYGKNKFAGLKMSVFYVFQNDMFALPPFINGCYKLSLWLFMHFV